MFQERLRQIGPEEFVQAFAKEEKTSKKTVFCDMKRTSNLEAYVQWFNRLSYLVASEICSVSFLEAYVQWFNSLSFMYLGASEICSLFVIKYLNV